MEIKKVFDEMLSSVVFPPLRREGFNKVRRAYYYLFAGNWGIIDFQHSNKSDSNHITFTINVGIASRRILHFLGQVKHDKKPDIWDTQWRVRIGHLMPENVDTWWTLDHDTDVDALSRTILHSVVNYSVPAIHRFIRDEDLCNLWLTAKSPSLTEVQRLLFLAVLLKQIGPYEYFEATIKDLQQKSAGKPSAVMTEVYINKLRNLP